MQHRHAFAVLAAALGGAVDMGCTDQEEKQPSYEGISKGEPPNPCGEPVETQLAPSDPTLFNESGAALLAGVLPLGPQFLFWVPYDIVADATFAPGVSTTSVSLELEALETEPVVQHVATELSGTFCGRSMVGVPVRLSLKSADGALDERIESVLQFWSPSTAVLDAFLPAESIAGSFAFVLPAERPDLEFLGLSLGISFWPGGSMGNLGPVPHVRGLPRSRGSEPRGAFRESVPGSTPAPPSHWGVVAVWPRREGCESGVVYEASDRLAGWSPEQVARELSSHFTGALVTDAGSTPVRFSIEPPTGLLCVQGDPLYERELSFYAPGRLAADAAAAGSPLEHLDLTGSFQLTARSSSDGSSVQHVRWQRDPRLLSSQSHADFVASTGLEPVAKDAQQTFRWLWVGASDPSDAGDWALSGEFLVQSTRQKDGMVCQGQFVPLRGTTLPPPVCETVPFEQVDDTLIRAELEP